MRNNFSLLAISVAVASGSSATGKIMDASGCTSGKDHAECSRNGLCTNNECVCDSGWKGNFCGQLDLGPVPKVAAYGMAPNVTSW
jgi:hypothetical protein